MPLRLVHALGLVKAAAAAANRELGVLDEARARAIERAAREVAEGRHDDQFVLDVYQTGSGTSTNMNANEVIARLAARWLPAEDGGVHPNDHVNRSQSSNDVMPTALHVAARLAIRDELLPALQRLHACLVRKAAEHADVVKIGRTHLMDATPLRFGQEIGGWARQIELGSARVEAASAELAEVALGGTAVGTGLNAPKGYAESAAAHLAKLTGKPIVSARDLIAATWDLESFRAYSSALAGLAVKLSKIASDLILLSSGPRAGLGELRLPALQPGSSIMPGKVNPVMPELVNVVAFRVMANDLAVTLAAHSGQLQLNAYEPLAAIAVLESQEILRTALAAFRTKCVEEIQIDPAVLARDIEQTVGIVTALNPVIGYERASELAAEAYRSGRGVLEIVRERKILSEEQIQKLLDPEKLTGLDPKRYQQSK
jgi:aspartate ammonia-lyase